MATPHTPHPWIQERQKINPKLSRRATGFNNRLAVAITGMFGSMWTFYALAVWMIGWMLFASVGLWIFRFDPYPFTFLLFLSNVVQLLSLPILAVGQQVLSHASEKQAEQTFKDAEAILKLEDEVHRLIKINNELTEEIHAALLQKYA